VSGLDFTRFAYACRFKMKKKNADGTIGYPCKISNVMRGSCL